MKVYYWIIPGVVFFATVLPLFLRVDSGDNPSLQIKQVKPLDDEVLEEWERVTNELDLLGVSASRTADSKWPW